MSSNSAVANAVALARSASRSSPKQRRTTVLSASNTSAGVIAVLLEQIPDGDPKHLELLLAEEELVPTNRLFPPPVRPGQADLVGSVEHQPRSLELFPERFVVVKAAVGHAQVVDAKRGPPG